MRSTSVSDREQFGLARAGCAAANIDRRHRRPLGEHHRDAGDGVAVFGLPDQDAGDIGDQIAHSGGGHDDLPDL